MLLDFAPVTNFTGSSWLGVMRISQRIPFRSRHFLGIKIPPHDKTLGCCCCAAPPCLLKSCLAIVSVVEAFFIISHIPCWSLWQVLQCQCQKWGRKIMVITNWIIMFFQDSEEKLQEQKWFTFTPFEKVLAWFWLICRIRDKKEEEVRAHSKANFLSESNRPCF